MVENEENVLAEDNHPKKKFIATWRNKWITSHAGSIDDFIATYEALAEKMRRWKEAGIILDPDIIGGVDDDYAQFCTYDEAVALKEGFEEEVFEEEDEEDEAFKDMIDKTYPPLEFQINEHLTIKTMGGLILIFIDDEPFRQCRYLLLVNPQENDHLSEINSIDEAEPLYKNDLENRVTPYDLGITYEQEFWAHCSNIQAWVEHEYDSRLLHRNLAFPLLKKLTDVGDGKAKKVFKDEIAQRFVSGYVPVMLYLFQENYLDVLTSEEFNTLLDEIDYSTLDVRKILAQIGALTSSKYYTQFLVRLRDEFQEFLEENTIYIEIGEYKFDTSEMSPVVITPDSNYFIRGSNDGKLKEFNILTGELVRVFGNHEGPVYALAISEDGSYLASSSDKTIKVWSYALGSHLFTLEAHDDAVNCLQFDPDGEFLLSGSVDDTIKVWNLKDRVVKRTLTSHWGEVVSLAFSEDGDLLVSGALDKTINIWDTHKGVLQTTLIDPEPYLQGVAITKYKDLVVSSSYQNIKIWDLNTQKILRTIPVGEKDYGFYSFVLTPDSRFIVAGLQGPLQEGMRLSIWRIVDGKLVHSIPFHQNFQGYCQELNSLTISKEGVFIVGTARDRMVKVWMNFLSYMELEEGFMKLRRNID